MSKQLQNLLSTTERNILFFIGGSILAIYLSRIFISFFFFIVTPPKGSIDFYTNYFPMSDIIAVSQFLLIPIFVILLFVNRNLIYSFIFTLISVIGYGYWIFESFAGRKLSEINYLNNETFFSYLMVNSSIFDFFLFLTTSILFMFQSFLLLRFTLEKFQIK